ncbi:MAG TPA: response regulator transcription factor [Flavobacteriales bacterium]|nr:response regulator transcription factor [Flavobacteriales bacterium]
MAKTAVSPQPYRWTTLLSYGAVLATVVVVLKYAEYRYWVRSFSSEVYIAVVAVLFTAVGIWLGSRLIASKKVVQVVAASAVDEQAIRTSGLSARELEVLQLMAEGRSNQEIADRLFISLPTVKSHSSSLFVKLEVKRRTEAVHKAKSLRIIV